MTDSSNLTRIVQEVQPEEVYNLAERIQRKGWYDPGRHYIE